MAKIAGLNSSNPVKEIYIALYDWHGGLLPLLVGGDIACHLKEGDDILAALRLSPLCEVPKLLFRLFGAVRQEQVLSM